MKGALTIARREVLSFFVSPVAYFVLTGFLLIGGYFFFVLLGQFNVYLLRFKSTPYFGEGQQPNLNEWVIESYFHTMIVILVFLIPILTMKLISEERRRGTFELLITSPISISAIVLGKFFGAAAVVTLMILGAGAFPLLLCIFGDPEFYPILSGILGVLLCALAFTSIAMAASSFTDNQVAAGITSMVVLLLLYVISSPAESIGGVGADLLNYLSPITHLREMLRGVISTKSLIYFISLISFGIFLSTRSLEGARWR